MTKHLSTAAVPGQPPSKYDNRLRTFGYAIGLLLIAVILWLGFATVASLVPSTQDAFKGHLITTTAVGEVRTCDRSGPISSAGFGTWWTCRTDVRMEDGRTAVVALDRSLVSPADIGIEVPLREMCKRSDHTACVYRGPSGSGWAVPLALVGLAIRAAAGGLALVALLFLVSTIVGRARLVRLLRRSPQYRD